MLVGYKRVSTVDQNLDRQDLGGIEKVFEEKISGKTKDRPQLKSMIEFVRTGDEVRVWSIDRLGRNLKDLLEIVEEITAKGASISFVKERMTFAPHKEDPLQQLLFVVLAQFAEFERAIIEQRRLEGIAAAKAAGRYKKAGRKRAEFDVAEAVRLSQMGMTVREIAKALNASKSTVHMELQAVSRLNSARNCVSSG